MSNNYSEQIFQSIDTIISQRLNEVSFDKTEICEIISQDEINNNKYWVSNGSLKYEAYSTDENRKYLVNQKVYVTVPQGNYDLRKLIIGSYSADETNENLYVNPFNHLVTSSSHNVSDINITTNTSGTSTSDSRDLEIKFNYSNITNFDYIGLEFGLDTSSLQGTYKGTYSIELQIYNNKDEQLNTSRIILYNTDLYGNPYSLIPMLKFQHLFPFPKEIKNITDITKIRVLFAQDGNFEKAGDIKLQDIKLYFGYDSKVIDTNQLSLYLSQEQSIDYQKNDTNLIRNLYLEWQHIDNSGKQYIFNTNQNVIPNLEYYIYWMKYVSGYKKENENDIEESETYWKTLEVYNHLSKINPFRYLIELNTNVNTDQYKVGIKYKYSNETDWKYIEAPGIVFNNLDIQTPPGGTNGSQDSIRLELDEGDTGVYNYYGLDGNVVDHSYLKTRNITAKFIDAITFDNEYLERVEWEFPSENSTMIVRLSENEWDKAQFKIKSDYLPGAMNNRIWCRAYFSTGEIRQGSLTLQFGEASTSGSAYKLNIDFIGNNVCIKPGKTITVKAKFEREDGGTIDTEPIIKWSFYKNSASPLTLKNTEGVETEITAPTDILSNYENFAILQATIENYTIDNGLSTNLTAYLPIPAAADNYSYISGTTRIVYDALGNSVSQSKEKYQLFDDNYNIVENIVWRLSAPTKNEKEYYSQINTGEEEPEIYYDDNDFNYSTLEVPQFKLYNNEISLVPLSYIPKEPEVVCLTANLIEGNELITVWSQPIFTMQNTWQYDLINNWNGSFKINEEQGSLLAPLLVAGKKEGDNQFTGVMLGNVKLAGEKASGLYGFQQGSARFYFTENGEAYIGKGDHHFHLNHNGELGIKVASFELNVDNDWLISSEGISKPQINDTTKNKDYYIYTKGKFGVDTSGTLYAKNGYFSGEINVTKLTLSGDASSDFTTLTEKTIKTTSVKAENLQVNAAKVSGKLTAAEIDASKITSGYINVDRIKAGSITALEIAANTITANEVSADIITTSNIKTQSLNADQISGTNSNTVTFNGNITVTGNATFLGTIKGTTILQDGVKFGSTGFTSIKDRYHDNHPGDTNMAGTLWSHWGKNIWLWLGGDGVSTNSHFSANTASASTFSFGTGNLGSLTGYISSASHFHTQLNASSGYVDLRVGGVDKLTCAASGGNLKGDAWNYNGVEIKTTGSDIRIKHSISSLDEKYSIFFDNIQPVSFIYNQNTFGYGTSQRIHTGFIANKIEIALQNSGLTNQEFAGLVIQNPGTDEELYTLRYEEFIALNTQQIQKLKTRVTELEQEIKELKQNEI